jgi:5-methyltetrahydropteroyltriglutamate--homocysteine methyltransferase
LAVAAATDSILTTHVGSLPRPPDLAEALVAHDQRRLDRDQERWLVDAIRDATAKVVLDQVTAGVDVVSDGEVGKVGYSTYVKQRLTGYEGHGIFDGELVGPATCADLVEYPTAGRAALAGARFEVPICTGPITFSGLESVQTDIENLSTAMRAAGASKAFMSAASPGVISIFLRNQHYPSYEDYLIALGDAMRTEYEAIAAAGFMLQLDCPDLAMAFHVGPRLTIEEFRKLAQLRVDVLNEATRNVPQEQLRMHVCWGNYDGPHHHDIPLTEIIDIVVSARPQQLLIEAANPRHEHEWRVFQNAVIPDDKIVIPGVIDTKRNYIEHPRVVADRIQRFTDVLGRERVMAGTDCGFATFATFAPVDPEITWAKLHSLAEGASLAVA